LTLGKDFLKTPHNRKDLNPGQGKESLLLGVFFPCFRPAVAGSTTETTKGNIMYSLTQHQAAASLSLIILLGFGFLPVRAVVPRPDGGYPNFTTAEGTKALTNLSTGAGNTAVGWYSLFSNTDGSFNTAVGAGTLLFNVGNQSTNDGVDNTAIGTAALLFNATGSDNTAVGTAALVNNDADANTALGSFALNGNTTGTGNTAVGIQSLRDNSTGGFNTASGFGALVDNTTGATNTAHGALALQHNTTGDENTACGAQALSSNILGSGNTAAGFKALSSNTTDGNTAVGFEASQSNTTGVSNTAVGQSALVNNIVGCCNTAIGDSALSAATGDGNIALGTSAGTAVTTANNVISIGHTGNNVDNSCFIGNIRGTTTGQADAIPVVIDSFGQLGTMSSSRRFKKEISPMDKASEAVLALRPVTFRYKTDKTNTPQFGLVAEDVARVNPDLVVRDKDGEIYTVRYDSVNAMLLNEFLKEHRKVEELKANAVEQQEQINALATTVKEQASRIQKVSAQLATASLSRGGLELDKSAPETALSSR
jgi:hypothetical protein